MVKLHYIFNWVSLLRFIFIIYLVEAYLSTRYLTWSRYRIEKKKDKNNLKKSYNINVNPLTLSRWTMSHGIGNASRHHPSCIGACHRQFANFTLWLCKWNLRLLLNGLNKADGHIIQWIYIFLFLISVAVFHEPMWFCLVVKLDN